MTGTSACRLHQLSFYDAICSSSVIDVGDGLDDYSHEPASSLASFHMLSAVVFLLPCWMRCAGIGSFVDWVVDIQGRIETADFILKTDLQLDGHDLLGLQTGECIM